MSLRARLSSPGAKAILCAALLATQVSTLAVDYEQAPTFKASDLIDPATRSGPYHRVAEDVPTTGYLYQFQIESEFGTFSAEGRQMLDVRLREINALVELAKMTRSEAFAEAVAHAAAGPYRTAVSFVTHPVKTVTGIPGGIGRFLKGMTRSAGKATKRATKSKDDDAQVAEGEAQSEKEKSSAVSSAGGLMGLNSAKRRIAAELGVDPYSDNAVLQAELERVGWASTAGGLVVRFAVPGVSEIGYLADVENLVWNVSPEELEALNAKALSTMGVSKETQDRLFENRYYSPTLATKLVHALAGMNLSGGQSEVVALAAAADSLAAASFVTDTLANLRTYHDTVAPITAVVVSDALVAGMDANRTLVLPLPVDYLFWTSDIDVALGTLEARSGKRELRLGGAASPAAQEALSARGWRIQAMAATVAQ